MAKIIKICKDVVSVGMDDGAIKVIPHTAFTAQGEALEDYSSAEVFVRTNFCVGEEVDVFGDGEEIIIIKRPVVVETKDNGGININMVQETNNVNENTNVNVNAGVGTMDKPVNKIAYILLALLLGGFGVHRAYAGKPWAMRLIFSLTGIPAIIALFEGVSAIFKKPDANGDIYV